MAQFWVVAGPNGVGKTTFADRWLAPHMPVISPDSIASSLQITAVKAGKQAIKEQDRLLDLGVSFGVDTTFSGNREVQLMRRAASAGFKVNLIFVCVDRVEICLARVFERVARGGHTVPANDVTRRYYRSLRNLEIGLTLADRAYLLDNTGERRRLQLSVENERVKHISSTLPAWIGEYVPEKYTKRNSYQFRP
jgi:predicted ABC-type ATPase